jgi:hemerythrin
MFMGIKFIWTDDYSVGDEILDNQHKHLFELGNQIQDTDKSSARKYVMELYKYIRTHFIHEERHMQSSQYPFIEKHKTLHEQLITDLNELTQNFTIDDFDLLVVFLHDWFIKHVLMEDKKYFFFIHSAT